MLDLEPPGWKLNSLELQGVFVPESELDLDRFGASESIPFTTAMQSPNIIVITALVAAVAARPQLSQLEPFFAGLAAGSDHTSIAANPGRVALLP